MYTRMMREADVASDHYLISTRIKLKLRREDNICSSRKKFNIALLEQPAVKNQFRLTLKNRFSVLSTGDDEEDNKEEDGSSIGIQEEKV